MNGANARHINDSCQQNTNPIANPTNTAKKASTYGPILSVLTPLINEDSDAIADVKTLVPFSLKSWNPISFYKIAPYNIFLIFKVTFSPNVPKQYFYNDIEIKQEIAMKNVPRQYLFI